MGGMRFLFVEHDFLVWMVLRVCFSIFSALIPIKNDPAANDKALEGVREDKRRDANDGSDGGWVRIFLTIDFETQTFWSHLINLL